MSRPHSGFDMEALARVSAHIQSYVDDERIFGASVIVARRGQIALKQTFGTIGPNGRPIADDDVFSLMSLSKSFTDVLVLRAIDEGRFTLDTKVVEILQYYTGDGKEKATLPQLLTHTAGTFPSFLPADYALDILQDPNAYA